MNKEEAKIFLRDISRYPDEIDILEDQIKTLPFMDRENISKRIQRMEEDLTLAEQIISNIENIDLRIVLRRRSLFNQTWQKIGEEMFLSYKTVINYHDQATEIFAEEWNRLKKAK
ncbi:MAG: hypothetical protein IJ489_10265 [Clostridia bacterium]|nr:hypothetical protein [Clostridia bacterium]